MCTGSGVSYFIGQRCVCCMNLYVKYNIEMQCGNLFMVCSIACRDRLRGKDTYYKYCLYLPPIK